MAIIFFPKGKPAERLEPAQFEAEDELQEYLFNHPEIIPLSNIQAGAKLLILAREFRTKSGPMDELGVDQNGEIYIVETKLYKNPDKRGVVAQVLGYGASLWRQRISYNDFIVDLNEKSLNSFNQPLTSKLANFFSLNNEDVEILLDNVRRNLNEGRFKSVVLMDEITESIKDLILFLNENSRFDLYALEFKYYKHEEGKILIPQLYGDEVKKNIDVASASVRKVWNEELLLADAKNKLIPEEYAAFQKVYSFCKDSGAEINFGTGSTGSFSPIFPTLSKKSIFTLFTTNRLRFNFKWVAADNPRFAYKIGMNFYEAGFKFPQNYEELHPSFPAEEWSHMADRIPAVIRKVL